MQGAIKSNLGVYIIYHIFSPQDDGESPSDPTISQKRKLKLAGSVSLAGPIEFWPFSAKRQCKLPTLQMRAGLPFPWPCVASYLIHITEAVLDLLVSLRVRFVSLISLLFKSVSKTQSNQNQGNH